MAYPGGQLVIAYHGCDIEVGKKVVEGMDDAFLHLKPSKNPYDWLGDGCYFFEDDFERALAFAWASAENPGKRYTKHPILEPFVIGAVIRLGNCLDLSKQVGIAEFRSAYDELQAGCPSGQHLPINHAAGPDDGDLILRNLDRAVINYIHGKRTANGQAPYDTVRGFFHQGAPAFETSAIGQLSHVQLAVRNTQSIVGYFFPAPTLIDPFQGLDAIPAAPYRKKK